MIKKMRKHVGSVHVLKVIFRYFESNIISILARTSPLILSKIRYRLAWGKWPNLITPKLFDEKLLWIMLCWQHPLKTECGDKYGMRLHVVKQGFESNLPKLYEVCDNEKDVNYDDLPDKFVLKCTHGCKCNIFCKEKSKFSISSARLKLNNWMNMDFSLESGEIHYSKMTPRIICEEYLSDDLGDLLPADYKIFCFNGKAHCTMACVSRRPNDIPKLDFYDRDWKNILPYATPRIKAENIIAKPDSYNEMVYIAETLAKPFPFVRIDFYNINNKAILGEMTFTPGACVSADYMTEIAQTDLGKMIQLPEKYITKIR